PETALARLPARTRPGVQPRAERIAARRGGRQLPGDRRAHLHVGVLRADGLAARFALAVRTVRHFPVLHPRRMDARADHAFPVAEETMAAQDGVTAVVRRRSASPAAGLAPRIVRVKFAWG